jgi:hypothetical protein
MQTYILCFYQWFNPAHHYPPYHSHRLFFKAFLSSLTLSTIYKINRSSRWENWGSEHWRGCCIPILVKSFQLGQGDALGLSVAGVCREWLESRPWPLGLGPMLQPQRACHLPCAPSPCSHGPACICPVLQLTAPAQSFGPPWHSGWACLRTCLLPTSPHRWRHWSHAAGGEPSGGCRRVLCHCHSLVQSPGCLPTTPYLANWEPEFLR